MNIEHCPCVLEELYLFHVLSERFTWKSNRITYSKTFYFKNMIDI